MNCPSGVLASTMPPTFQEGKRRKKQELKVCKLMRNEIGVSRKKIVERNTHDTPTKNENFTFKAPLTQSSLTTSEVFVLFNVICRKRKEN